jgi:integrase
MRDQAKLRDRRLYWRGGRIWCRVPGPSGRIVRMPTRCVAETAATARADELERRFADPAHAAASAATLEGSVKALVADMRRRNRSPSTIAIAKQKLGHFVRLWGSALTMAELQYQGPRMVLDYIDQRQREGASNFTISKELQHLKMALAIAKYLGAFSRDLAELFPPFFSGGHQPRTRKPSQAEVLAICAEVDPARAAHLAFIAGTGARRGEARRACRSDVHLEAGFVHLRGTKTIAADDDVPMTPLSRRWVEAAVAHAPGKDGALLFSPWGNLTRDLAAACVRAKVERVTPNDLRRAFGSWHRDAGVSAELVSKLLRHTTDKLAQTTYAKLQAPALSTLVAQAIRTVPELYPADVQNDSDAPQRDDENAENSEKTRATLGNRTPDLRFTKPNDEERYCRIKTGMARASEGASVPILYAHPVSEDELSRLRRALAAVHGDVAGRVLGAGAS